MVQVLINGILGKWDFGEKPVSEKRTYQDLAAVWCDVY
jgi:hypothetical protein